MQRLVSALERIAGFILAFVTALTFVSVVCRYVLAWPIPDSFDIGRLLIGAVVFWGIAAASYGDSHIRVDVIWSALGTRWRRRVDAFASLVTLGVVALIAWMGFDKLASTALSGEQTFDLRLPLWPFYALAWLGMTAAVILIVIRVIRHLVGGYVQPAPDSGRSQ
jgi:TRAP-type C4-dicarboxylate transport system permease small subunit